MTVKNHRKKPAPAVTYKVGDDWKDAHGLIRIMAIADGYAMCRRRGCMPFVVYLKNIPKRSLT